MWIIRLEAVPPDGRKPSPADAHLLHDAAWAHAASDSTLEHVHARAGPHEITLTLLFSENGPDPPWPHPDPDPGPDPGLPPLVETAFRNSAFLTGWTVRRLSE